MTSSGTSEYLQMDDGESTAVRAEGRTRNQAKAEIAALIGCGYIETNVRKEYLKLCDCEGCKEGNAYVTHGFDEYWVACPADDEGATEWWVDRA